MLRLCGWHVARGNIRILPGHRGVSEGHLPPGHPPSLSHMSPSPRGAAAAHGAVGTRQLCPKGNTGAEERVTVTPVSRLLVIYPWEQVFSHWNCHQSPAPGTGRALLRARAPTRG